MNIKNVLVVVFVALFQLVKSGFAQGPPARDTVSCGQPITLQTGALPKPSSSSYSSDPIPYAPYNFSSGTIINLVDDGITGSLPIGFPFCFFGNNYTNFFISANGWISFTQPNTFQQYNTDPSAFPSTSNAVPKNAVALWDDWSPPSGGTVNYYTTGTMPNRKLVVNWNNVRHYVCSTEVYRGQIVLYERSNMIEFHVESKPSCPSDTTGVSTQGIHNAPGTVAYTVPGRNATKFLLSNDSWRFTPNGPDEALVFKWFEGANQIGSGASVTVDPATTTTYVAEVRYACSPGVILDSVTVIVDTTTIDAIGTNVVCNGQNSGAATVSVSGTNGPYTYSWSTTPSASTPSITSLSSGTYSVTVSNADCSFDDEIIISEPAALSFTSDSDPSGCGSSDGSAIIFPAGGTGTYTYSWETGSTVDSITGVPAGFYEFSISDANGCSVNDSVNVEEVMNISSSFAASTTVGSAPLAVSFTNLSTGADSYLWNFGNGQSSTQVNPAISYPVPGTYTVRLTSMRGSICSTFSEQLITVTSDSVITEPEVFIPNVVVLSSANPENKLFKVRGDLEQLSMLIYNRWGRLVFESPAVDSAWDPSSVEAGTYYYVINLTERGKEPVRVTGFVTVFK